MAGQKRAHLGRDVMHAGLADAADRLTGAAQGQARPTRQAAQTEGKTAWHVDVPLWVCSDRQHGALLRQGCEGGSGGATGAP